MRHDGNQNECDPSGNIMAGTLGGGKEAFKWSTCSATYLNQYRRSGGTSCLQDTPSQTTIKPNVLVGVNFTADEQCKAIYGPTSGLCSWQKLNVSVYTVFWVAYVAVELF